MSSLITFARNSAFEVVSRSDDNWPTAAREVKMKVSWHLRRGRSLDLALAELAASKSNSNITARLVAEVVSHLSSALWQLEASCRTSSPPRARRR